MMRNGLVIAAVLALAGCVSAGVTDWAAVPGGVRVDRNDSNFRKNAADTLFWTQDQRDANFRNMEGVFPGNVVRAGTHVRALPMGEALDVPDAEIDSYIAANNVSGLIVVQDGKIRLERYARGFTTQGRWTSFSVAKSFTSVLVGAAIRDGYIKSVDDPVTRYVPELAGSGYDGVTLAQLLTMTSGVRWNEDYTDPKSDVARMFVDPVPAGEDPIVYYMRRLPRQYEPGTHWVYKTGETHLIGALVRRATGKPLATYLSEKVWKPYGMEQDAFWMVDPARHELSGCCLSLSLRDYARFGMFVLDGGKGVVPDGWIALSTRAHAETGVPGYGYGYQWWTYPEGRFGAQGIFGQNVRIDPKTRTVIVLLGAWPRATDQAMKDTRTAFANRLFAAASR